MGCSTRSGITVLYPALIKFYAFKRIYGYLAFYKASAHYGLLIIEHWNACKLITAVIPLSVPPVIQQCQGCTLNERFAMYHTIMYLCFFYIDYLALKNRFTANRSRLNSPRQEIILRDSL